MSEVASNKERKKKRGGGGGGGEKIYLRHLAESEERNGKPANDERIAWAGGRLLSSYYYISSFSLTAKALDLSDPPTRMVIDRQGVMSGHILG
jgi:hypothetical protein